MFETPLFLIAAIVGGGIPLILHLMQKKRTTPVYFPTLRFLLLAQKASSRRVRIEHLLLWLLRTLIMILLGSAFAMPMLRTAGFDFLARSPRDVAIVLDMSFSMGYRTGRDTVWERALELAAGIIEGLGENDRYCIYLAHENPRPLIAEPVSDKETGLAQLNALQLGYGSSRLEPAIHAAYAALTEADERRLRELHVITDNQALPWSGFGAGKENEGEGMSDDRRLTVFVSLLGVTAPENVAPGKIELIPAVISAEAGGRARTSLVYSGPPRETVISMFIGGEEIARRSVLLGTRQSTDISFAIPPLPVGIHQGRLETPADNLPVDDAFHFLIRVREDLPSLVVGGESETFFLRAALRAIGGGVTPAWIKPSELPSANLREYTCIFLCDSLPLAGQELSTLNDFIRGGGVVAVFPGRRAGVEDYRAWGSLPAPEAIREFPRHQSRRSMAWRARQHPVLLDIGGPEASPVVAVQQALSWPEENDDEQTRVLASFGDGQPLLIERLLGDGSLMIFAVSADRSWSTLPLTPYYLPIISGIIEYSATTGASSAFIEGTDRLAIEEVAPEATIGAIFRDPSGEQLRLRSSQTDGRTSLYAEDVRQPGIYELTTPEGPRPAFAVNVPREESDLTPIDRDTLEEMFNLDRFHLAEDRESLEALLYETRVGRTYGELLLWLVLLLIGAEFIYANHLARGGGRLTDKLTIASSGRVSGHVPAVSPAKGEKSRQ